MRNYWLRAGVEKVVTTTAAISGASEYRATEVFPP